MRHSSARLVEKRQLAESVWHLRFETANGFHYQSGQFIVVHGEAGGKPLRIPYSIASEAGAGTMELCVRCSGEGAESGFPCRLPIGAAIAFEGPFGRLVPRYPERDALLVAQGTGIGPIRSILRDLVKRPHTGKLTLLQGARSPESLLYSAEWMELTGREPRFAYQPTLSRADHGWIGLRGYVQDHLEPFFAQRELAVYICGSPAMVREVRERFEAAGFDGHQVIYERYGDR